MDSKLALEKERERKGQLTSHLNVIIQKNEEEKAKKLAALMKELDMP